MWSDRTVIVRGSARWAHRFRRKEPVALYLGRTRTFMRWTGIVALGLVAVIVAVYVAKGVIGTVQVGGAKDDARESVGQLARDTGDVNRQVATNRETLGTPLQSWSQVVCELTSNDAGWIVQSWEQGCSLEQVDVYSAGDFDRAESLRDVDPRVDVTDWSDEPARPPLPAQDVRRLWLHLGEPADVGRAGGPRQRGSHPRHGERARRRDGPRLQPWGVVFCEEPVDRPVMPE